MQSIKIDSGSIRLAINDDENRIIEFNPHDVSFVENFYGLISEFEKKEIEYLERAKALDDDKEAGAYGIPQNTGKTIELIKEICAFLRDKIDSVFGEGTSQKAFGDTNTLLMFEQFLDGVTPYIQNARTGAVEKYTGNRSQRRASSRVMK